MKKNTENKLGREVLRKMIHLLELPVLLAYALIANLYGEKLGILFLTALLIILLEIEYIRLEYRLRLPEVVDIIRRKERDNIAGNIFFVTSTIICFAAYNFQIAVVALCLAVFGDLAASIIGIRFGRTKIFRKKTLEGFLAGFLTNLLVGHLLIPNQTLIIVPMALTASLVELWTGKLDDNLTVPLAAGFMGQLLIYYWQIQITTFPGPVISWLENFLPFLR